MDSWFVALLIAAGILSAAGPIVWASAILQSSLDVCENAREDDERPGAPEQGDTQCLDASLARLDRLIHSVCRRGGEASADRGSAGAVTPYKQLRIQNLLMEIHGRFRRLDAGRRQPYESRVARLSGLAASAGIHWSPALLDTESSREARLD